MIDFRYHLVSVVAIFFALAAGIALGAGPLQAQLTESLVAQSTSDRLDEQRARAALVSAQSRLAFADAFVGTTSPAVVGAALAGRTVCAIVLPDADPDEVRAMRDEVAAAGGAVVSSVTFTEPLLDPVERQFAEGLAGRLLGGGRDQATDAGSYQLLGAALARSFLSQHVNGAVPERDDKSTGIQAAFEEAELITVSGRVDERAQLALVVGGEPSPSAPEGQAEVAAEIAAGLDVTSGGVVVAGPAASADHGVVRAVRESDASDQVSSVDALGLPAGRVVTVLALAEQARGGVGQYGMGAAATGAVPAVTGR